VGSSRHELGALLSLDEIETIQNLSVILHDSRSTLQGIRAKTISIYLTSEALYVNQEYENVSLSNEMAIIKTILHNRTVDNVTIMIPEAPDMAAVPVIKSLYAGFHDDDELELNSGNTVQRLKQGTSVNRWTRNGKIESGAISIKYTPIHLQRRGISTRLDVRTTMRNRGDHGVGEVMVEIFD
jgi:hypothetical protein